MSDTNIDDEIASEQFSLEELDTFDELDEAIFGSYRNALDNMTLSSSGKQALTEELIVAASTAQASEPVPFDGARKQKPQQLSRLAAGSAAAAVMAIAFVAAVLVTQGPFSAQDAIEHQLVNPVTSLQTAPTTDITSNTDSKKTSTSDSSKTSDDKTSKSGKSKNASDGSQKTSDSSTEAEKSEENAATTQSSSASTAKKQGSASSSSSNSAATTSSKNSSSASNDKAAVVEGAAITNEIPMAQTMAFDMSAQEGNWTLSVDNEDILESSQTQGSELGLVALAPGITQAVLANDAGVSHIYRLKVTKKLKIKILSSSDDAPQPTIRNQQ